jgi:glycosyltransferase involved in cell wall biosynthesis
LPAVRLLHLHSGNLFGGVETSLLASARFQRLWRGVEHTFALCYPGRLQVELAAAGASLHMLCPARVRWPWTVWGVRRRLRDLLRRHAFDVVACHGCWAHALMAPVVRSAGLPLIFWIRDQLSGRHWLERWAQRTPPDFVLTNSEFTLKATAGLFGGVPRAIQHPLVLPPEWAESDRERIRRSVRAEVGTPEEAVVVVHAARLEPWKGHRVLLDAVSRLRVARPWECWFVGGPQRRREAAYFNGLQRATQHLGLAGRVRFLGQSLDVMSLLAAADIHCQPNTRPEPFGVAFVEAMHAGLAVVTVALGGATEIVDDTCGVLLSDPDPGRLADALSELIANDERRKRLGQGGVTRAREHFEPGRSLARLHSTLTTLLPTSCSVTVPSEGRQPLPQGSSDVEPGESRWAPAR